MKIMSNCLAGAEARGPSPLEVEAAELSGDVDDFADEVQAGGAATFHRFRGQLVGINAASWSAATLLNISKTTDPGADASNLLAALSVGDSVYLQQNDDATRWGRYTLGLATDNGTYMSYALTFIKGSATLPTNNHQTEVTFAIGGGGGGGDLTYVHNQVATSASWSVAHNLAKYPTVAVVDSGNNVLLSDVHYVDANNLTVGFGAATSGKVFCN